MPTIHGVIFDVGETLLDMSRRYGAMARALGVPPHTFSAVFGATVAAGGQLADVLSVFSPAEDGAAVQRRIDHPDTVTPLAEADLYPGARQALATLRAHGLRVGVVGNQPPAVALQLRALDLPADFVATSAEWGAAKPEPAFFHRAVAALGDGDLGVGEVVYVGDQLINDVLAARAAGLLSVRVRQGPWGFLQHDPAVEDGCLAVVDTVAQVPAALGRVIGWR